MRQVQSILRPQVFLTYISRVSLTFLMAVALAASFTLTPASAGPGGGVTGNGDGYDGYKCTTCR